MTYHYISLENEFSNSVTDHLFCQFDVIFFPFDVFVLVRNFHITDEESSLCHTRTDRHTHTDRQTCMHTLINVNFYTVFNLSAFSFLSVPFIYWVNSMVFHTVILGFFSLISPSKLKHKNRIDIEKLIVIVIIYEFITESIETDGGGGNNKNNSVNGNLICRFMYPF